MPWLPSFGVIFILWSKEIPESIGMNFSREHQTAWCFIFGKMTKRFHSTFLRGEEKEKKEKEKKWGCQSTANHISLQCVFVHHLRLLVFSLWIHPQFTKDSLFCWHGSSIDMGRRLWRLAPLYLLECIWKECGILGFLQVWSIPHWSWRILILKLHLFSQQILGVENSTSLNFVNRKGRG